MVPLDKHAGLGTFFKADLNIDRLLDNIGYDWIVILARLAGLRLVLKELILIHNFGIRSHSAPAANLKWHNDPQYDREQRPGDRPCQRLGAALCELGEL